MKFFEVTAKCGHVGKRNYFVGVFYEKAYTATRQQVSPVQDRE